ncbi:MAG: type II secretion system F family protein [Nanoarchaeota archaeon]|nr:type II secretion system F family protein [Nanoarchaeota archaeon]MBU0977198.1 type II secretion system F family protein [Nanoarchaeota archaeon]
MKLKKMHWFGIVAAVVITALSVVFFRSNGQMLLFLVGIGVGVGVLPFIIGLAIESGRSEKINETFLEFTRNLAEAVSTGTPISKGIVNMRKKDFGVLNPHVEKLSNQIGLGIPVGEALHTFAREVDSAVVKRAIALIREAEKAGGDIDYILDSTAKSIAEVEKLKKERNSAIYGLVVQGYIIFFIFIGIILVMEFKIIPLTAGVGGMGFGEAAQDLGGFGLFGGGGGGQEIDPEAFSRPFLYLLLTQGFFIGLVIGKLTEGRVKSGLKHSFIMVITAFLISTGSKLFLG